MAVSSPTDPSELGAPAYWTWALTGIQVMALWSQAADMRGAGWSGAPCSPDGSRMRSSTVVSRAIERTSDDARTARYRAAKRALWDRYGIAPSEQFIELESPAVRLRVQAVGF